MITIPSKAVEKCRLCGSGELGDVLDYGMMPMAGGFVHSNDPRVDAKAPLTLGLCVKCGLMQTLDTVNPDEIFREYSYKSSASPALVLHFGMLANFIMYLVNAFARHPLVVDIGCNDGVLLNQLQTKGVRVVGVDPSDVALEASRSRVWGLVNDYATIEAARQVVAKYGQADIVTCCNVLAHTDDIHEMIECARSMLHYSGTLLIEVQHQAELIRQTQFDTVYHEHCSYFSLANLVRLLDEHHMTVTGVELIDNHSGSIRVMAAHRTRVPAMVEKAREVMSWEAPFKPKNFASAALKARDRIRRAFDMMWRAGESCCAYGAAGRATILMNWCELDTQYLQFVADASPRRQGRVVPGVKVPIVSPDMLTIPGDLLTDPPTVAMITAWNYKGSIIHQHPAYTGLWMTPLPEVTFT